MMNNFFHIYTCKQKNMYVYKSTYISKQTINV